MKKKQHVITALSYPVINLRLPSILKISLLLLFFVVFRLQASNSYAQRTKISLNLSNVTIEQTLDQIEKKSDFVFLYNDKTINKSRKISIKMENKDISQILAHIFSGTNVKFFIQDKQIILSVNQTSESKQAHTARKIKGTVTDAQGEPLIGVNVLVKGTTTGIISDFDGNFEIEVPTGSNIITFSYIGYKPQEIKLSESKIPLKIVMTEDTKVLQEVVITAMGIERKAESLTYATQKVGGKEFTRAKDVNFINSLQGKSAGLTITPNSSGAGGGASKITLRGQSSILGNNQPLIVLDGIPMSSSMSSQTNEIVMSAARDGGDLLSTINPDDIASMSILKGPNAAALYGSAANNGVIIITTKGGREGKIRVDVSSNLTLETPLMYSQQQKTFAPEIVGSEVKFNGWGNPVSDLTDDQLAQFPYLTRNPRNNVTDFFKTGQTYNNSVALSGGTEHSSTYFSYGNTVQKGLIDKNKFVRHNLLFKQSYNLFNNKLKIDFSLNYITQKVNNTPVIGIAKGTLTGLYATPRAVDLRYFDRNRTKTATEFDDIVKNPTSGNKKLLGLPIQNFPWALSVNWMNNPYFMLDAMNEESIRDRIMANLTLKYDIYKGLSAQARVSVDKTMGEGTTLEKATIMGANTQSNAATYWGSNNKNREIYSDYLLTYDNSSKNVTYNVTVGTSFKRIKSKSSYMTKTNDTTYVAPNNPYPSASYNGSGRLDYQGSLLNGNLSQSTNWEAAVFATAQVGFWNKGYIDVSFRDDWAKAFQQFAKDGEYIDFAYYSVGGNLLLKELLPFKMPKVNSMKLRVSYSVVGNSVPARFYNAQAYNPINGSITSRPPSFDNPKPETTKAFEAGLDGVLFDNKLDFDLTVYQSIMEHQFMEISTASSNQSKPVNSGRIRNRGIEFTTNYHMTFGRDFRWSTGINLSYNDNKILETYRPLDGSKYDLEIPASGLNVITKFIEGGSYGDLYSKDFEYDESGKIKLIKMADSDGDGEPEYMPSFTKEHNRYVGNTTAKFNFGWNNTLSYKNFSFYMLIDGKIGGKVLSLTEAYMDVNGLSERTANARLTDGGMVTLPDGQKIKARSYYEAIGGEHYDCIYNATNVRFREISLGYTFYDLFGISKNLSISMIARNLGFIYKDSPVDPDISTTAGNTFGGIDSFSLPTTRSYGLNIKVTF